MTDGRGRGLPVTVSYAVSAVGRWLSVTRPGPVRWWQAPVVATPRMMARIFGACIAVAGVLATLIAWSNEPFRQTSGETGVGVAAIAVGSLIVARGARWGRRAFHGVFAGAVAATTVLMWLSRDEHHATAYAVIYGAVSLLTFFFFSWPVGWVYQVVIAGSLVFDELAWDVVAGSVVAAIGVIDALAAVIIGLLVRMAADADVDPLTGLSNRRGLDLAFEEMDTNRRTSGKVSWSLAVLNFDGLRAVNASLGRVEVDRLLRGTAQAWRRSQPAGTTLARTGGDEFMLLLPGDASVSAARVDALRGLLRLPCGLSAGIAEAADGDSPSYLLTRADAALRHAKDSGAGRTFVDTPSGAHSQEMIDALPGGQFAVVYQPIVDLDTGSVLGAEALLRWTHPDRGAIPPAEFIPLAEASGFILELGRWVLRTACVEAAGWDWAENPRVSVNVSGRQLHDPRFVEDVSQILADTGLPASRLVLEVTETMVDADTPVSLAALKTLRRIGVRIAIDDFGTGYSSLSRLEYLPVDILKIDQSFVRAIRPDTGVSPVIAAIVALARGLGMSTLAEGVEQPYQAAALRAHGCRIGQGWLYGKPGPARALAPANGPVFSDADLSAVGASNPAEGQATRTVAAVSQVADVRDRG
jgi:diguanylate cyclase (GGDEF)-like protein